jgi:hypothetical protein
MATNDKSPIPYGTYGRLKGTVDRFAESTVPTSLNQHVLDDLSGYDFSALTTALRFLGLINEDRTVRQEFRDLVEARKKGEGDYKAALLDIISSSYQPVIGKVDVVNGTLPELEKAFKDAGIPQGQMVTKAVRFYVKALEDCGVKVSDYITKPKPRTAKGKSAKGGKKSKDTKERETDTGDPPPPRGRDDLSDPIPNDYERLPIPGIEGAFIQYPKNLNDTGVMMFEAMVSVLRTYVQAREPRKGSEGKKQ